MMQGSIADNIRARVSKQGGFGGGFMPKNYGVGNQVQTDMADGSGTDRSTYTNRYSSNLMKGDNVAASMDITN